MNTYAYELNGNLYINLTSRCTNACAFCVRNEKSSYFGHKLWLEKEPTAEEAISLISDVRKYREIVFCGFGEPTIKLNELLRVAAYVKSRGGCTRLNTNGHGNLIHGRDVSFELAGKTDRINVSLNEADAASYAALCKPVYGERAFAAVQEFAKACAARGMDVWFSAIDCIGEEKLKRCRQIAEDCGVPLRVRKYLKESE